MFPKNAMIYRFTQPIPAFDTGVAAEGESLSPLADALVAKTWREPGTQELSTYGFIPLFHGELVAQSSDYLLVAAKKTERMLPGAVVRDALKKKVDAIEAEQMRKVYKKERDQLKDDIVQTLLPQAFLRHKVTYAMIFGDMIVVDASSANQAEDLLSTLREVLGSLPVRPLTVKVAPTASLTDWVKSQQAAPDFFVLDECELRDTSEDGGTVRCKRQDLTSEETQLHLSAGKLVTKLAMAWQDKLSFVLDDKLTIKRLRWEDLLQDQAAQDGGDDRAGQLVASLAIAAGTLADFIPALIEAMGGEEEPQGI